MKVNDKLDEEKLVEKFMLLAEEGFKSILLKVENRTFSVEERLNIYIEDVREKMFESCQKSRKNFLDVADIEQTLDYQSSELMLRHRPKQGREGEFEVFKRDYFTCSYPFLMETEKFQDLVNSYYQLQEQSYSLCQEDCKNFVIKSRKEGNLNFDNVKMCLKDCNNMAYFNFTAYENYMNKEIDIKLSNLHKL
jgi:hypothetical protein